MEKENKYYERILELGICEEETLNVITCINGYTIETMDDVIYAKTGYHSLEQYEECELAG